MLAEGKNYAAGFGDLMILFVRFFPVMRDIGTDAGTHVEAQGVRVNATRLPEDDPVPEVAEDGCPAG